MLLVAAWVVHAFFSRRLGCNFACTGGLFATLFLASNVVFVCSLRGRDALKLNLLPKWFTSQLRLPYPRIIVLPGVDETLVGSLEDSAQH